MADDLVLMLAFFFFKEKKNEHLRAKLVRLLPFENICSVPTMCCVGH